MSDLPPKSEEADPVPSWPASWLRPKGNLTDVELWALLSVAALPLVVVLLRILSLPDVLGSSLSGTWLPSIGGALNQAFSLQDVPAGDRNSVLYMLFLPTSALVIAVARLTFGIRVIGFRAILISVGFQQSGIVPSLILIAVVVAIVVGVRPALRRIRLPETARLSVIISIGALILVSALLLAPWTRSEVLWRIAFFPVIVLGLLSENIAKTLDQNTGLVAIWRTGMTIVIGMLIAGFSQIPALREIVIQFPELVITQIVLIILVSEFLDLRLFQDLDSALSGMAIPRLFGPSEGLRVAIVRNRRRNEIIGRLGVQARSGYSRPAVRRIAAALAERGHTVERFEGDMTLLSKLEEFLPEHPQTRQPGGIVLDLSSGIQGIGASGHVAAMLEMAGVPYVGATPKGHLLAKDRIVSSQILGMAGVTTPDLRVVAREGEDIDGLAYPVIVKAIHRGTRRAVIARDREKLEDAIRGVLRRAGPQAIVEQYIVGREIEVALIGNDPVECLPLVEVHPESGERMCPARLDQRLEEEIRVAARTAYRALEGRDAARVRVCLSRSGTPYVIEVEPLGGLEEEGTFERAGVVAGLAYPALLERIVTVAKERYRGNAGPSALSVVSEPVDPFEDQKGALIGGA
jgi:D-alanine-D-alanine ligase